MATLMCSVTDAVCEPTVAVIVTSPATKPPERNSPLSLIEPSRASSTLQTTVLGFEPSS